MYTKNDCSIHVSGHDKSQNSSKSNTWIITFSVKETSISADFLYHVKILVWEKIPAVLCFQHKFRGNRYITLVGWPINLALEQHLAPTTSHSAHILQYHTADSYKYSGWKAGCFHAEVKKKYSTFCCLKSICISTKLIRWCVHNHKTIWLVI